MHGTMSRGTTGGAPFYCFLHFGCKPGSAHAITAEVQRLSWLVKVTQRIRASGGDDSKWIELQADSNKEIRLNQSSHLLRGDRESLPKWLARLEDTLRIACAGIPDTQMPLEEPNN